MPSQLAPVLLLHVLASNDTLVVVAAPAAWGDDGSGAIVSVATLDQSSGAAGGPRYFYFVNPPVLYTVSTSGPAHLQNTAAPQWAVILHGANLYGYNSSAAWFQPAVAIGGAPCAPVTVVSADTVTCIGPSGVGAGYDVSLTLLGRSATLRAAFNYSAPRIDAISPTSGDPLGPVSISIMGSDFTPGPAPPLSVRVSGQPCEAVFKSPSLLTCTIAAGATVGAHDVVVYTGAQASNAATLTLLCARNFYGAAGQPCAPCPLGGVCGGGATPPYSQAGWYRAPGAAGAFEACAPAEACLGGVDSRCAPGYVEERCSGCDVRYYRLSGACVACPSFTLLFVFIFIAVVAVVVSIAYWLDKKRVNLAALSIGIDFVQVIAMFGAFNFHWPPLASGLFSTMSAAAFNLQVLAPDCLAQWTVLQKWFLVQSLPPIVLAACAGTATVVAIVRRVIVARQRRANRWGIAVRHLEVGNAASLYDTLYGIFFAGL